MWYMDWHILCDVKNQKRASTQKYRYCQVEIESQYISNLSMPHAAQSMSALTLSGIKGTDPFSLIWLIHFDKVPTQPPLFPYFSKWFTPTTSWSCTPCIPETLRLVLDVASIVILKSQVKAACRGTTVLTSHTKFASITLLSYVVSDEVLALTIFNTSEQFALPSPWPL